MKSLFRRSQKLFAQNGTKMGNIFFIEVKEYSIDSYFYIY